MSDRDREHWDERYAASAPATGDDVRLPAEFAAYAELFPTSGFALDIACGRGLSALWLARRGMEVRGVDISPAVVAQANDLARGLGLGTRCRFEVADLDGGLPTGPTVNVVLCHKFRDSRLDDAVISRLAAGGLLAISALSEVGASPGPFRATAGELPLAFDVLEVIGAGEGSGIAWLIGRKHGP